MMFVSGTVLAKECHAGLDPVSPHAPVMLNEELR